MGAVLSYVLLIAGLLLLIKGADWLVRGASSIARVLNVSAFVIGLTVVSFGTSLPELVVGLVGVFKGHPDFVVGNVVGSNIANILLVLGVASMICPLTVARGTVWREIPFTLLASLTLAVLFNDQIFAEGNTPILGRGDGIILLAFFGVFVYYVAQLVKSDQDREWVGVQAHDGVFRSAGEIVVGGAGLVLGGQLAVMGAESIATAWGFSDAFIGLTVLAIGTSLPELATSTVAAYRKNVDIAVGNVVGSNIFNIFIVLGITSVARPIRFNTDTNYDLAVMIAATLLLFVFMFIGKPRNALQRYEGAICVFLYVVYLGFLVYRG